MLISKLYGGMGNQMFQYAFGKAIATKLNVDLVLDTRLLNSSKKRTPFYTIRSFDLDLFNIDVLTDNEINLNNIPKDFSKNERYLQYFKNLMGLDIHIDNYRLIKEDFFNDSLITPNNKYILDGYWQKEDYFKSIKETIRADFTFKEAPSNQIQEIENYIRDRDSIAIQVRKTDYLSITINRLIFEELTADYYRVALEQLKRKLKDPIILIFSDDNKWVEENLNFIKDEKILILDEWKGDRYQFSMYLMNRCKHHIISNSSFGWWGAYLSNYPENIVIAPKRWFKIQSKNKKVSTPNSWIRI